MKSPKIPLIFPTEEYCSLVDCLAVPLRDRLRSSGEEKNFENGFEFIPLKTELSYRKDVSSRRR